eukprot:2650-Prorocentrum_minimum.AAC.2
MGLFEGIFEHCRVNKACLVKVCDASLLGLQVVYLQVSLQVRWYLLAHEDPLIIKVVGLHLHSWEDIVEGRPSGAGVELCGAGCKQMPKTLGRKTMTDLVGQQAAATE